MAGQPGQEAKDTGQETIFNSGIGNDWGEAFEAEDFMASPKEDVSNEFFLPDEPAEAPVNIPVGEVDRAGLGEKALSIGRLAALIHLLLARFGAFPLPLRIAAVAIPISALTLFFFLHKGSTPIVSTPEMKPQAGVVLQPGAPAVHGPESAIKTPEMHSTPAPAVEKSKSIGLEPGLLRKKWHFPAIIVHAKTDNTHDSVILTTDLTLVLKLAPEAMPPLDKDSYIREILYQFYTNQPLDDLKRYALERSEMNRKMKAWITKQWPELPLDSLTIDRYQLF